jgi:tryptophanyl-tRNA synthetase
MLHAILRVCFATVESARIKSLRDASAKMSKSDADESACVLLCDSADTIVHKIRRSDQPLPANSRTAVLALADEGVNAVGVLVYSRVHAVAQDCWL